MANFGRLKHVERASGNPVHENASADAAKPISYLALEVPLLAAHCKIL